MESQNVFVCINYAVVEAGLWLVVMHTVGVAFVRDWTGLQHNLCQNSLHNINFNTSALVFDEID